MEFVVLHDEKNEMVYNFKVNNFIPRAEVDEGCFLPSIGMAYRILKLEHLFLSMPLTEKVKPKKIRMNFKDKVVHDNVEKSLYEVSWC